MEKFTRAAYRGRGVLLICDVMELSVLYIVWCDIYMVLDIIVL